MERPLVSEFEYSEVVHGRIVPLLKGLQGGRVQETFRNQEAGRLHRSNYPYVRVRRYQCIAMSPVGCRFGGQKIIESRAFPKRSWSKTEASEAA
jgi:hypothetical protein